DQGVITGRAHETLRTRAQLAPHIAIAADVMVKHATPPPGLTLAQAAADAWERGLADALIVSGTATGAPTDAGELELVGKAVPDAVVWIGSGLTLENATELLPLCDAAIVGTSLARAGAGSEVDALAVRRMAEIFSSLAD